MKALRARVQSSQSHPHSRRTTHASLIACGALLALAGCATPPPPTANESLPANLQAGPDEVLQEVAKTVHGDENYICRRTPPSIVGFAQPRPPGVAPDGTQLLWAEVGSESMLVDADGEGIGTVAPAWHFLAYDGSYAVATPAAEAVVKPDTLTWARYTMKFVTGPRPGEGRFANISSIQRIDTTGGVPPQPECTQEGEHRYVPFTATYMIYRPKGEAPAAAATVPPMPQTSAIASTVPLPPPNPAYLPRTTLHATPTTASGSASADVLPTQ